MSKDFRFHIPIELTKGDAGECIIGGICSTDDMDSQGERILQSGLDFGQFLDKGFFNDNHDRSTGGAVGIPKKAVLKSLPGGRKGWYVEGNLLDNARAKDIRELAEALERSEDGRKLGFSVEGSILERDPSNRADINKAIVREVAITRCPVNTNTELNLLTKALSAGTGPAPVGVPVTGEGGAAVMAPEALEARRKRKKKKKMKKGEAIDHLLDLNPRLSWATAERIVNLALQRQQVAA